MIKIILVNTVSSEAALSDGEALPSLDRLPFDVDGYGGKLVVGAVNGAQTLSYIDAMGNATRVDDPLPEGYSFTQDAAVWLRDDPDEWLLPVNSDAADEGAQVAQFGIATLDASGVASIKIMNASVFSENGGSIGSEFKVFSLGNRQVGVFSDQDTGEADDVEVGILTVSDGTLSYNTFADGSNGESVDPANIVMQPLSGGGVVTVVGCSWTEDGSPSYEVIQTDAAGEVIGETLLTEGQVCGLGINNDVHGIEADISEVGYLELYLTSGALGSTERFESEKIMFDLLPDQSGEPAIALAEVAIGEDIDGTFGDNVMRGTPLNDDISGKSGDDVIHGDAGADNITDGMNYDTIFGGDGNDYISGDRGFDALRGGAGSDDLYGGLGKDDIRGGDGNDYLSDVAWHDFVRGNHGND
jgi:Ca2+-binding RTX toxin-like protein